MKKSLSLLALALSAALSSQFAFAQEELSEDDKSRAQLVEMLKGHGPFLQNISEEDKLNAIEVGRGVVGEILGAYEARKNDQALIEEGTKRRKFADSIADEALQGERDKALEFLGIDPQANSGLYIFVSWSMPVEMLRSYILDAMWSGATVVFKGVPRDMTLGEFIGNNLRELVYGKSAAANISIDPRMFDAYSVTTVPTIVYTTVRGDMSCQGVNQVPFTYEGQNLSYDTCPQIDENDYWKISGAVSTRFALQAFVDDKAPGAEMHLKAMAKGFAEGKVPGKEQLAFTGKWESMLSPEDIENIRKIAADTQLSPQLLNSTDNNEFRSHQGSRLQRQPFDPKNYQLPKEEAKEPKPQSHF